MFMRSWKMRQVSKNSGVEKKARLYTETLWLGMRIYRGLILNLFDVRAPLFCGHKLTYNCNLRCKMCGQWGETGSYFAYDKSKRRKRLDVEVIDRILGELVPMVMPA